VAVVGKLVKKKGKRQLYTKGETIHKTIQHRIHKTETKQTKQENKIHRTSIRKLKIETKNNETRYYTEPTHSYVTINQ
jgi:hypothetical protein